jgi:hypothetical protein
VRRVVPSCIGLLLVATPLAASAFCRTTTVHEPIPYDPVASGCWTQGKALAWPQGAHVGYSLSKAASDQVTIADATRVADLAFEAWNQAACTGGGVDIDAYDEGTVSAEAAADDCGLVQCDPTVHDTQHVIVFDDQVWPHNDPSNTLALTTVTYGVDSGEIYDADTEVNTAQHTITAEEPPPAGVYDLQAILTHEAGHFLGMAHATTTTPIMFAQYQPGAVTLTDDDVAGICNIYPPAQPKAGGCAEAPGGGVDGGRWAALGGVALAVAAACRRRRVLRRHST